MKQGKQETRDTFRDYAINTRSIYEGITGPARVLAANLRAAIATVNRDAAPKMGGAALIETDADKQAAIGVYLDEIREVLTWELIGQYNTREPGETPRYRIEENAGTVTVWDNLTRYGFRFQKGDTLAQYTLTVITPGAKNTTREGLAEMEAVTEYFRQWAAHRFPVEFAPEK